MYEPPCRRPNRWPLTLLLAVLVVFLTVSPSSAQDDATETPTESVVDSAVDEALLEELREGAGVYTAICSSCHQPGGAGIEGLFPPLLGNPRVEDAEYMAEVINNGRRGELIVNGVTYDSVMPSFSTLSDSETQAVIAYIRNGFEAPPDESAAALPAGPVADTELPAFVRVGLIVASLLAAVVASKVLAPRLASQNDRLAVPWLDAWLKTAVIVVAVVFLTMFLPDWALKTSTVSKLSRPAQDFVGVSLWSLGLVTFLGALWYAHRESRI